MIDHPTDKRQLETIRSAAKSTYTAYELAEQYGLSDGQARTLIEIHGPSLENLDRVIALQNFE